MDVISTYPLVCRPSADNVKSIYSLVLTFARLIEAQSPSSQTAVQRSPGSDAEMTRTVKNSAAEGAMSPTPPLRSAKAIGQGLKGAIFSMGSQKSYAKS